MSDPKNADTSALGYTFRGDAGGRTGLFRPAAGNLSLEVGGQTRVRVNAAGRVGINTSTPSTRLHVSGDFLCSDAGQVYGSAASTAARPSFAWEGDPNTGIFRPAEDEIGVATAGTERLRVDPGGLVGVNTSSPRERLDVKGVIQASEQIKGAATSTSADPSFTWTGDADTGFFRAGEDAVGLSTGGTERLRVDAQGRLGCGGQTSPLDAVDVAGSLRVSQQLRAAVASSTAAQPSFSWAEDDDTGVFRPSADALALSTGGTQRMVVTDQGRVGVNVDAPQERLHVDGTARATTVLSGRLVLTPGAR